MRCSLVICAVLTGKIQLRKLNLENLFSTLSYLIIFIERLTTIFDTDLVLHQILYNNTNIMKHLLVKALIINLY